MLIDNQKQEIASRESCAFRKVLAHVLVVTGWQSILLQADLFHDLPVCSLYFNEHYLPAYLGKRQ